MSRALLVVDVQEDFCEGGSLAVAGGTAVAEGVAALLSTGQYDVAVASQDWHVDPEGHFAAEPDYALTWPAHCVVGTTGPALRPPLREEAFAAVFRKGEHTAAYSAFEGAAGGRPLAAWLRERGITALDVCGIATDHCVRATVLDARAAGFDVRLLRALCAAVAPETGATALAEMADAGAVLA
jgi:nicotinamidase/pyrazinamidase